MPMMIFALALALVKGKPFPRAVRKKKYSKVEQQRKIFAIC